MLTNFTSLYPIYNRWQGARTPSNSSLSSCSDDSCSVCSPKPKRGRSRYLSASFSSSTSDVLYTLSFRPQLEVRFQRSPLYFNHFEQIDIEFAHTRTSVAIGSFEECSFAQQSSAHGFHWFVASFQASPRLFRIDCAVGSTTQPERASQIRWEATTPSVKESSYRR